jgi:uncharacterized protein (UPF0332 family)
VTPRDELADHRIARAHDALEEAGLLIERHHFTGALNRLYYAARALLATKTLDSSRHSGVIALFQEHFVKTGLISTDAARALPRAFEKRQTSDYGDSASLRARKFYRSATRCRRSLRRVKSLSGMGESSLRKSSTPPESASPLSMSPQTRGSQLREGTSARA